MVALAQRSVRGGRSEAVEGAEGVDVHVERLEPGATAEVRQVDDEGAADDLAALLSGVSRHDEAG